MKGWRNATNLEAMFLTLMFRRLIWQSPPCPRRTREMDGEPVWCKWLLPEDRAIEQGKWFIVISGDKAGLEIKRPAEYGCHFCKIDDYGKTWLAYRRPSEGEENAQ